MYYSISFPFQTSLPHLNLANKHGITLILVYIHTHLNVEANYLSWGKLVPERHLLPCIAQSAFQHWGQLKEDLLASSFTSQCQHYYTLENALLLGSMGLSTFNHPWTHWMSYVFHPLALLPLVLSKFLAENVTGQFRLFF